MPARRRRAVGPPDAAPEQPVARLVEPVSRDDEELPGDAADERLRADRPPHHDRGG